MNERVALYTRVSTEDQAKEGFSLAAQADRLYAAAKSRGWKVVGLFVDNGYSGRDIKRPKYQEMMQRSEEWDILLVLKMDRIHRNIRNFLGMMETLERMGKQFASVSETLDTTTAMGRFVVNILQGIAQLESEQIGERVYMGMSQKAKEGRGILGFAAPYGYRLRGQSLLLSKRESKVVRLIFLFYLGGATSQMIAEALNKRRRTRRGAQWSRDSVIYVLHNPVYAGFLWWDRGREVKVYADKHPALVTLEEFNRVQERLQSRQPNPAYRKTIARVKTAAGTILLLRRAGELGDLAQGLETRKSEEAET